MSISAAGESGGDSTENDTILVTFFMIVTNRDIYIADAAVGRFKSLYAECFDEMPFRLLIYANGLSENNLRKFCDAWSRLPYVKIIRYVTESKYVPGAYIENADRTASKIIEGPYKPGAVIWDEELPKIDTPFFCTVDADFEMLRYGFIREMVTILRQNEQLAGVASDYTPTQPYFDTYSNTDIIFHERWNTWCCLYRREVNRCKVSHFATKKSYKDGEHSYDDTGYFQQCVQEQLGMRFKTLDEQYQREFIHYGAFSKNRNLKGFWMTLLYRRLAQIKKNGITGTFSGMWKFPDYFCRKGAALIFSFVFGKSVDKRLRWDFTENKLDKA